MCSDVLKLDHFVYFSRAKLHVRIERIIHILMGVADDWDADDYYWKTRQSYTCMYLYYICVCTLLQLFDLRTIRHDDSAGSEGMYFRVH